MALSEQVARLAERQGDLEREQGKARERLTVLSEELQSTNKKVDNILTSVSSLARVVNDMAKKDEIAEAVAERMRSNSMQRWSKFQKIGMFCGGSVAIFTLVALWIQIYMTIFG